MERLPWSEIGIWILAWASLFGVHRAYKRGWFSKKWAYRACLLVCLIVVTWLAIQFVRGLTGHTYPH